MLDGVLNTPLQSLTVPPELSLPGFRGEGGKIQLRKGQDFGAGPELSTSVK